jgi:hypothetical protein
LTDTLAATDFRCYIEYGFDGLILDAPEFDVSYDDWKIRKMFEWPDMFNIFVTGACLILRAHDKNPEKKAMYSSAMGHQKYRVISQLRKRLIQPGAAVDDATVLGICHLGRLAAGEGDWEAARIHRKYLRQMVQTQARLVDARVHFLVMEWLV